MSKKNDPTLMALISDSLGTGVLILGDCPHCGMQNQLCIVYKLHKDYEFKLPDGIKSDDVHLILDADSDRPMIGLTCGDYAKLHRQIAHITDAIERRGGKK